MILQNTISRFNFFRIASLIAECVSLVSHEKKSVDCRSKEQRRAFQSHLSDRLWKYQCNDSAKYHFQIQLLSNWKFCFLSVLLWRATKKKICGLSQQGTEKSIFREIFRIGCDVIMTMILQNTIFTFNLFEMESFDNCFCYIGNKQRLFWIFCKLSVLSFKLALTLSWHWSCKLPFPYSTYFELKVLKAECCLG